MVIVMIMMMALPTYLYNQLWSEFLAFEDPAAACCSLCNINVRSSSSSSTRTATIVDHQVVGGQISGNNDDDIANDDEST